MKKEEALTIETPLRVIRSGQAEGAEKRVQDECGIVAEAAELL